MRRYAAEDESRVRTGDFVRDWAGVGLLDAAQGRTLAADVRVDLRRTGRMLRIGLAVFTAIALAAGVGLLMFTLDIDSSQSAGVFLAICGAGCFVAADRLVSTYRFYRHGIEEACAAAAVLLWTLATAIVLGAVLTSSVEPFAFAAAAGIAASASYAVYRQFGFRYAGVAAIAAATLVPFPLELAPPVERLLAATIALVLFVAARRLRAAHPDDVHGDDGAVFAAAAFIAVYLVINLHAAPEWLGVGSAALSVPWFRWTTYALIWVLPVAGVWLAVRDRERPLLDAAGGMLLVTLITNKPYRGRAPQPWDPIVFGIVLAVGGAALKRWLASGPGDERAGFTAARVSHREAEALRAIAVGSSLNNSMETSPSPGAPSGFQGGRSGGGGGGADF
jgi:hypothetical protein